MGHFRSLLHPFFILLLPGGLWLLIGGCWQLAWLPFRENTIYYGLIVFRQVAGRILLPAVLLSFFASLALFLVMHRPSNGRQDAAYALTLVLLFIAIPCSCVAGYNIGECGTSFTHEARIIYHEHSYQLAFVANPCSAEASYNLYRCDTAGFICDRVYALDSSLGTPLAALGNYQAARTATLTINSTENGITIHVDGNTIYTYFP